MQIGRHAILVGGVALTLGCTSPPAPPAPVAEETRVEVVPPAERDADRSDEIQARNEEILERLRQEQLARENASSVEKDEPSETVVHRQTELSGMEEMQARAAELERRMAEIGRVADHVDDNYRRYLDACHEKFTTATTSPQTAALYYDPYQPIAVNNETTPYCRKLWSDIQTGAGDVDRAMEALVQDARRKGVLPGHLRDLARKYRLDREGWRP